jgi:hypothetical protein
MEQYLHSPMHLHGMELNEANNHVMDVVSVNVAQDKVLVNMVMNL